MQVATLGMLGITEAAVAPTNISDQRLLSSSQFDVKQ